MNSEILTSIRAWKPVRAAAQIDLSALLSERFVFYVTRSGLVHTFCVSPSGRERQGGRKEPYPLPIAVGTPVYSVNTEAEMVALRDLICFPTDSGRYRLYWVRNTGLHDPIVGPCFSERHMEWIASHVHRVWRKYVDPNRRRKAREAAG